MSTLELAVLIGSVVLIAVVWMIPVGRSLAPATDDAAPEPNPSLSESASAIASHPLTTPIKIPVRMESEIEQPTTTDAGSVSVIAPPVVTTPSSRSTTSSFSIVYSRGAEAESDISRSYRRGSAVAAPVVIEPSAGLGYPVTIPIPVAISDASSQEGNPLAESGFTRPEAPFENSSANAKSLTLSSHSDSEAARLPWRGSSSVAAEITGVAWRASDPASRRRLLLAAGAGLVFAASVAARR